MISAEIQAEILSRYFSEKHSVRAIAREFGLNRESVRKIINRRGVTLKRKVGKRESILDPFRTKIEELVRKDERISSRAALNHLRPLGYTGGETILRELIKELRGRPTRAKEAFLRLEFEPGETAQVDWAEFGDVFGDGIKVHCFAMVLCYSRYMYIEFTRSEKFEDFIRCHENAFKFFGGHTKECWYDNLATAVTDRLGNLIKFNARFMAYMGHHGIRPHACNVARGNEKGRVENLINYIRLNFWSGRVFKNFEDLKAQSIVWRNQIANQREHRSTRRVVRLMFEAEEKAALLKLNHHSYETDEIFTRVVPPDFHVIYETNRYSVPWTLVGMPLTVRANATNLKFYFNDKFVSSHDRSYLKYQVFTNEKHREGLLTRKPGATRETWQMQAVCAIGPKMREYVELIRSGPRSLRNELSRIVALSTVYGERAVYDAAIELLAHGVIGVESLEVTLKKLHHPAQMKLMPEPILFNQEKLNRVVPVVDLRRYDALLFESPNESASENEKTNDDRRINKTTSGFKAQKLCPESGEGFIADDRQRFTESKITSWQLDFAGESGSPNQHDTVKNPSCAISKSSNN